MNMEHRILEELASAGYTVSLSSYQRPGDPVATAHVFDIRSPQFGDRIGIEWQEDRPLEMFVLVTPRRLHARCVHPDGHHRNETLPLRSPFRFGADSMNARIETISEFRARYARHMAFVDSVRGKGWASYKPEDVPTGAQWTNDESSALEIYDWLTNPPARAFVYIDETTRNATTWAGDILGRVEFGQAYESPGFGRSSLRVPVTVHGINGRTYHGTYYKSAGDYARIKMERARTSAGTKP